MKIQRAAESGRLQLVENRDLILKAWHDYFGNQRSL
jgi:hypothetical protein